MLGVVEGLTEFLPISSTGHLILVAWILRLEGEAVKTMEIVVQAGALAAVVGLYGSRIRSLWRGLRGRDPSGYALLINLAVSVLPVAVLGAWLHRTIKARLFGVWPVILALAVGGIVMIVVDRWGRLPRTGQRVRNLESVKPREALWIGCAQCLSLWPGTSRAMVTLVAGLFVGLPPAVAAEYSFLLALPTLGAATLWSVMTDGRLLIREVPWLSIAVGVGAAAVVAVLAMRGFLRYLIRRGLAPFGWYRIGLATTVWLLGVH